MHFSPLYDERSLRKKNILPRGNEFHGKLGWFGFVLKKTIWLSLLNLVCYHKGNGVAFRLAKLNSR